MRLVNAIKTQPRWKVVFTSLLLAGLLAALFLNPRDQNFFERAEEEIKIAMRLCENVDDRTFSNIERLKIDNNKLTDTMVGGKIPEFKYVKTPRILLFSQGFEHTRIDDELFCSFKDPRDGQNLFFNYNTRTWEKSSRTRK